jgi:hypothetical protein
VTAMWGWRIKIKGAQDSRRAAIGDPALPHNSGIQVG